MAATRRALLLLALMSTGCSAPERPTEEVVRAAAEAAHHAALEDPSARSTSQVAAKRPSIPCSVSISNGEPHDPLAQAVLQQASSAIQASGDLGVSKTGQGDLELLVFGTQRIDPRSRTWDGPSLPHRASGSFLVAFVVLGNDLRYLDGDFIKCAGEYKECGQRMSSHVLHVCQGLRS